MASITGKYRNMLDGLQKTARQVVMDEIEEEVKRVRDYATNLDTNNFEELQTGIDTIKLGLKELAEKLY
jgi:uncharacterized protein YsxB (DUF464 family)